MKRFFLSAVLSLYICASAFAAYPYDSICQVISGRSGGSATLVAVSDTHALLLTCQHVVHKAGNNVYIHFTSTGEKLHGIVVEVGKNGFDIALVLCPRPKGLRPVPVTLPNWRDTGCITNAGYPGLTGTLEWQTGELRSLGTDVMTYTCRPIPGMSGGATFDQYGNLVGVITRYARRFGQSSSGPDMINFLSKYVQETKPSSFKSSFPSYQDPVPAGPPETLIITPEPYAEWLPFIWEKYNIQPPLEEIRPLLEEKSKKESTTVPLAIAATLEVHIEHDHKRVRKKTRRRRVFRRWR